MACEDSRVAHHPQRSSFHWRCRPWQSAPCRARRQPPRRVLQRGPASAQGATAGQAGRGGGRGGGGGVAPALFVQADINKDGTVTRGELMATIEKWYLDADTAKAGSITPEQLSTTLSAAFPAPPPGAGRGAPSCGGNSPTKTPCPEHVAAMTAALPAKAPARPQRARRILVLGNAQGFVHSSIPLAGGHGRGARQQAQDVDDHDHVQPGGHQRRESETVRCRFPREHDRLLP